MNHICSFYGLKSEIIVDSNKKLIGHLWPTIIVQMWDVFAYDVKSGRKP